MSEFFLRTEEIKLNKLTDLFVEMSQDKVTIEKLKSSSPVILVGSRGMGKSFLLRMTQLELKNEFEEKRILPVYVTFRRSSLIQTSNDKQFQLWMLSRLCSELVKALRLQGITPATSNAFNSLTRGIGRNNSDTAIDELLEKFENSWKNPGIELDASILPTIDNFTDIIQDICEEQNIERIAFFIDEAAHIFIPENQRQFFTMFRDLRTPYITVNAAVYPGVTMFGDTFEPMHDATFINMARSIDEDNYIFKMKELVLKQVDDSMRKNINSRSENFSILAYAANGNPRHLLKTIAQCEKLNTNSVNKVIREYYRTGIWAEHSQLGEKITGHDILVDWSRDFIENIVLPDLKDKNDRYLSEGKKTTLYFWVHKNAPQLVKDALRILEYTGIVSGHSKGIKASKSEVGTRYSVNFGCLLALESSATKTALDIIHNSSVARMSEFGANSKSFIQLSQSSEKIWNGYTDDILQKQLNKSIDCLDLTYWQKQKLREVNLLTIAEVLKAPETKLMEAYYVGTVKARQIKNSALAAVYEYLSG
ncbi:ORC-CDC6 family AAA ATPase [Tepidibacter mesophilus]|uniref:ORC-CDC6 family AAA ATPase n=1 Tax=Tepidibacter mesophilus TaxID=655607 RepID=UPI000C082B4F|nr:hypothetical protein [Tepidibacter mesophilus]